MIFSIWQERRRVKRPRFCHNRKKAHNNFVLAVRFFYVESCRFSLAAGALRFRHLRIFQNDGMEEKRREKEEKFFKKLAKTAHFKRSI